MREFPPTPYPEVNLLLERLNDGVQDILGTRMVGVYLHGSLALGDFNPASSDVDFVVVTDGRLPESLVARLADFHRDLSAEMPKWGAELEGSYIPLEAVRRYNPADIHHPCKAWRGDLSIREHNSDWVINYFILREYGVTVSGPEPATLIESITPDEVRRAVLDVLWWWEDLYAEPQRLQQGEYQSYAALSMCRVLYTLEHGVVSSKMVAAQWALETLDRRWRPLITRALSFPQEPMVHADEARALIRYTLDESRRYTG